MRQFLNNFSKRTIFDILQLDGQFKFVNFCKLSMTDFSFTANYCDCLFPAAERNVRNFATVFPAATLRELAKMMPESEDELTQQEIEGLTEYKVKAYNAARFLEITTKYRHKMEGQSAVWCFFVVVGQSINFSLVLEFSERIGS